MYFLSLTLITQISTYRNTSKAVFITIVFVAVRYRSKWDGFSVENNNITSDPFDTRSAVLFKLTICGISNYKHNTTGVMLDQDELEWNDIQYNTRPP